MLVAYNPTSSDESDPIEVTETMAHQARNDAHHEALFALLAGAEGCGNAARNARLAQDDELADFLSRVDEEIVEEAKRLLARRVAE